MNNNNITYISKNFTGEIKEYYKNGNLKFEGKYLKWRKWDGKGYDIFGELAYEIKEGKGLIKEYLKDEGKKIIFEGEYLNGERSGKGKEYSIINSCLIFEGEYLNGKKNGKGKEYYYGNKSIIYEGEYLNGERHWKGKCYYDGILEFEGEYLYGYKLRGKSYYEKKLEYEGEFLFNKKWNGKGYDKNGNIIYELINGKIKKMVMIII